MTNVKAGDLAIVVNANPPNNGRIVQVLYLAPACEFTLPNGNINIPPTENPAWVIKAVGSPFQTLMLPSKERISTWYGVAADRFLRPLPGDPQEQDAPVAEKEPICAGNDA